MAIVWPGAYIAGIDIRLPDEIPPMPIGDQIRRGAVFRAREAANALRSPHEFRPFGRVTATHGEDSGRERRMVRPSKYGRAPYRRDYGAVGHGVLSSLKMGGKGLKVEFQRFVLPNGAGLYVYPTDKFKTITLKVFLRRPLDEAATENAMLPLVLRRGTERFPTTQAVAKHLEGLYGAHLSADVVKIGEVHVIELSMEVVNDRFIPGGGQHHQLTAALDTLAQVLRHPVLEKGTFKGEYVDQERETLRRRIEGLINNKRQYAVVRCFEEMFKGEPFGIYKYGRLQDLPNITADSLYKRYQQVLSTSPTDIFVIGAVDPQAVQELAEERLGEHRISPVEIAVGDRRAEGAAHGSKSDAAGNVKQVVEEQEINQGVVVMGFRAAVRYPDDDYYAMLMYNGVLGAFPHSKLFMNVREKASLAYFAYSRLDATQGIVGVSAGIDVQKYDQAVSIIQEQLRDVQNGSIGDEEMEATRNGLINGYLTNADEAGRVIDSTVVGLINARVRTTDEIIAGIKKVGKEDIQKVARGVALDTVYFLRDQVDSNGKQPE